MKVRSCFSPLNSSVADDIHETMFHVHEMHMHMLHIYHCIHVPHRRTRPQAYLVARTVTYAVCISLLQFLHYTQTLLIQGKVTESELTEFRDLAITLLPQMWAYLSHPPGQGFPIVSGILPSNYPLTPGFVLLLVTFHSLNPHSSNTTWKNWFV